MDLAAVHSLAIQTKVLKKEIKTAESCLQVTKKYGSYVA
jgi:hypothetical protein